MDFQLGIWILAVLAGGLVGYFFGQAIGRRSAQKGFQWDLDRAEATKINAAFDLKKLRRAGQEIAKIANELVAAADWAEETVAKNNNEQKHIETSDDTQREFVIWNGSNKCPSCGRTGTAGVKCTNCGTIGCSDGNCKVGGGNFCKVCQKSGFKTRI